MASCDRPVACITVGAHLVRDAVASCRIRSFKAQSFRLPAAAELLSLCVAKEKVTKEKGHPAYAPCGHPARKVRGRVTGFVDSTSCADAKLAGIPAGHPAGFPSPVRRCRGAPGRAAGHRGPHFSEEPGQQPELQRSDSDTAHRLCFCFQALPPSAGHDGPLLYPGPLCSGEAGSTGRIAGVDRDVDSFSHGQDARSKSPAPAHGLAGQEPGKRQAGWPSLLVTFSLATQEKSDSVAEGDRPLFALKSSKGEKASRLKSLPQMRVPC